MSSPAKRKKGAGRPQQQQQQQQQQALLHLQQHLYRSAVSGDVAALMRVVAQLQLQAQQTQQQQQQQAQAQDGCGTAAFPTVEQVLNRPDAESKWTVLHKALYYGNIAFATAAVQLGAKTSAVDACGLMPTGLLYDQREEMWPQFRPRDTIVDAATSTLPSGNDEADEDEDEEDDVQAATGSSDALGSEQSSAQFPNGVGGGDPSRRKQFNQDQRPVGDLFTWGNNDNFVLGHPNEDNRRYPERVELFARELGCTVSDVVFCKYHTVILTDDGRVFTCGHGRGGRLGHNRRHETQLVPVQVPQTAHERIVAIAAAENHTIALAHSGTVFTFGSNEAGQLGSDDPAHRPSGIPSSSSSPVLRPIRSPVAGDSAAAQEATTGLVCRLTGLRGKGLVGCAAANRHSVVFARNAIYTFGENNGQLGHPRSIERFVWTPRRVGLIDDKVHILSVAANEEATVLLLRNQSAVLVLSNYICRRVNIAICRFPSSINPHKTSPLVIASVHAGPRSALAAVTDDGEIYVWSSATPLDQPLAARLVYPLRNRQLRVCHLSLGVDQFAFCTDAGHVYVAPVSIMSLGSPSACIAVLKRVGGLARAVRVVAGKGTFAAVCQHPTMTIPPVEMQGSVCGDMNAICCDLENENKGVALDLALVVPAVRRQQQQQQQPQQQPTRRFLLHRAMISIYSSAGPISEQLPASLERDGWAASRDDASGVLVLTYNGKQPFVYGAAVSAFVRALYTSKLSNGTLSSLDRSAKSDVSDFAHAFSVRLDDVVSSTPMGPPLTKLLDSRVGTDVTVLLGGGARVQLHRFILVARSAFFSTMLGVVGRWKETCQDTYTVDLQHVDPLVFAVVSRYLYEGEGIDLGASLVGLSFSAKMEFLARVLIAADELLLDDLKRLASLELERRLDIKNFEELLDIAECYQAQELQRLGFHFVAQHLDMLIEFRLLRPTTSWLVAFEEFYHEHYMNPLIFEGMRRGRGGGDDSDVSDVESEDDLMDADYSSLEDLTAVGTRSPKLGPVSNGTIQAKSRSLARRLSSSSGSSADSRRSSITSLDGSDEYGQPIPPSPPSRSPQLRPVPSSATNAIPGGKDGGWYMVVDSDALDLDKFALPGPAAQADLSSVSPKSSPVPDNGFTLATSKRNKQRTPSSSAPIPSLLPATTTTTTTTATLAVPIPSPQPPPPAPSGAPSSWTQRLKAAETTSDLPPVSGSGNWDVKVTVGKLSQKERKQQAAASAAAAAAAANQVPARSDYMATPPSTPPKSVWGSPASPAAGTASLKDIQRDEEKARPSSSSPSHASASTASRSSSVPIAVPARGSPVASGWASAAATSPLRPSPVSNLPSSPADRPTPSTTTTTSKPLSLVQIQQQQTQELQRLALIRSKSLVRIQAEERAVAALAQYYQSITEPGTGTYYSISQLSSKK